MRSDRSRTPPLDSKHAPDQGGMPSNSLVNEISQMIMVGPVKGHVGKTCMFITNMRFLMHFYFSIESFQNIKKHLGV